MANGADYGLQVWPTDLMRSGALRENKKGEWSSICLRKSKDRIIIAWDLKKTVREKCKTNRVRIRETWV